jgi:outer membrane biosynthesis protein TonB
MATGNNIQQFNVADIERYHNGQLSAAERHNLEKAALEDPFLADALEGYAVARVNTAADLADLKKRLEEKLEEKEKVIPIGRNNNLRLLRAAVVIAFMAAAGLLVYQFGFKGKKQVEIAQLPGEKNENGNLNDSSIPSANTVTPPATTTTKETKDNTQQPPSAITNQPAQGNVTVVDESKEETAGEKITTEVITTAPPPAPVKASEIKADDKNIAKADVKTTLPGAIKKETDADGKKDIAEKKIADEPKNNRAVAVSRKTEENNYRNQQSNVFRGRVTDQNHVGIPFANVTNLEDNAGTYTDAKGNFILTYPDSVLTVQVRSIGYEYNNVQLRNNVSTNQVTLQDDRSLSEVVISNKKPNSLARSASSTLKREESEPADGWDNYDSYLANNVKLPDEYVTKQQSTGEVQVSFEVDKNGNPVNFKIEKSLCKKCDEEAIRLIKDGPKWRRKARHGRTTVTITF